MSVEIELGGLELYGYHGVEEHERRTGQRFLFDVRARLRAGPAADRIEDALDYRDLAACVREVSDANRFDLLETLAAAIADELLARFPVASVSVRVRKPEVKLDPPVDYAAVTVKRES